MKPVIAIPQMGTSLFRKYMKSKYVYSLKCAGAEVCWIELDDLQKAVEETLTCDGLLLPGGADIEPAMYGQTRDPKCGTPNTLRDTAEPLIFHAFVKTGKPILGICRGMQMLNVCLGGTMLQDISAQQVCKHSDFAARARSTHNCTIEENTRLFTILENKEIAVNSMHHQAVDKPGDGLIVSAISSDGFTEAVELPGHPFCLGVQWHPEHMYRRDKIQRKLFQAFVDAAQRIR